MKYTTIFALVLILMLSVATSVGAQSAESIWLAASTTAYKTGETVTVTVNAISATPIQGFTFQIRYDPACLQPVNASSPVQGMNGLSLPQTAGLVDASFASTTPQMASGLLAEVQFVALGGCQTNLTLESAGLAIRDVSGFAAPLEGVSIGVNNVALNIDKEVGQSQPQPLLGTPLPLGAEPAPKAGGVNNNLVTVLIIVLAFVLVTVGIMFGFYKLWQSRSS